LFYIIYKTKKRMDTGHQALNLSAKNQARGGGGSSLRQSASTSSLAKLPQLPANVGAQSSPFDLLAAFGGDINSAVAAIAAASNAGILQQFKLIYLYLHIKMDGSLFSKLPPHLQSTVFQLLLYY
jgi:hypothetical protein